MPVRRADGRDLRLVYLWGLDAGGAAAAAPPGAVEEEQVRTLAGGFQVHGMRQDEPYTQWFALDRLREWGHVERTNRVTRMLRPPSPARSPWQALRQRFTRVTCC